MGKGITISLYLVDGEPSGIICAYLSSWTGQCIKVPRNILDKAETRQEIIGMGIYFLFGFSDENPDERMVYIGEADNVYRRLVQHTKDDTKIFWTEAVAFSSKDDFLTKGHVKYLEYELIKLAKENTSFTVINKNNATKSSLPEMQISDMERFLDNIKIILPSLGYDLLNQVVSKDKDESLIYYLEQSGIKAKGMISNIGFSVLKDSELSLEVKDSLSIGYKSRKESLVEKGIIIKQDDRYRFVKDYEFSSPSTAAAIIVGYAVNGRQAWKDKNGKSLKQYEEDIFVKK